MKCLIFKQTVPLEWQFSTVSVRLEVGRSEHRQAHNVFQAECRAAALQRLLASAWLLLLHVISWEATCLPSMPDGLGSIL